MTIKIALMLDGKTITESDARTYRREVQAVLRPIVMKLKNDLIAQEAAEAKFESDFAEFSSSADFDGLKGMKLGYRSLEILAERERIDELTVQLEKFMLEMNSL